MDYRKTYWKSKTCLAIVINFVNLCVLITQHSGICSTLNNPGFPPGILKLKGKYWKMA